MTNSNALFNVLPSTTPSIQTSESQSVQTQSTVVDTELNEPIDLKQAFWRRTIADRVKLRIDQFALDKADDGFRSHLGWSVIGHSCSRYLWYHWRWMWREVHSARMERIFLAGHVIEAELRHVLKELGATFLDTVDEDGKQIKVSELWGHFGGSVDGVFVWPEIGLHEPTLLECKSSKTGAPFSDLEKKSMPVAKPQHYVQQSGYGKQLNIRYACYIARNKNDSDLYVEIVDLDWSLADKHIEKAKYIMGETTPPPRISNKRNYYICNMCAVQEGCHDRKQPIPNCRNCKHASPVENAQWFCGHWQAVIPKDAIIKGCVNHQLLPY